MKFWKFWNRNYPFLTFAYMFWGQIQILNENFQNFETGSTFYWPEVTIFNRLEKLKIIIFEEISGYDKKIFMTQFGFSIKFRLTKGNLKKWWRNILKWRTSGDNRKCGSNFHLLEFGIESGVFWWYFCKNWETQLILIWDIEKRRFA